MFSSNSQYSRSYHKNQFFKHCKKRNPKPDDGSRLRLASCTSLLASLSTSSDDCDIASNNLFVETLRGKASEGVVAGFTRSNLVDWIGERSLYPFFWARNLLTGFLIFAQIAKLRKWCESKTCQIDKIVQSLAKKFGLRNHLRNFAICARTVNSVNKFSNTVPF